MSSSSYVDQLVYSFDDLTIFDEVHQKIEDILALYSRSIEPDLEHIESTSDNTEINQKISDKIFWENIQNSVQFTAQVNQILFAAAELLSRKSV